MNFKRVWDYIDVAILVSPLIAGVVFAVKFSQLGLAYLIGVLIAGLVGTEIWSKIKTGRTITQNFKKLWQEDRKKAFVLLGLIAFFFIYLCLHLTILP